MRSPGIRLHKLALFGWAVIITAVLLLLSLPVLAGGPYLIALALYLAIYWELLELCKFLRPSIGNLTRSNLIKVLRDQMPNFFKYIINIENKPIYKSSLYSNAWLFGFMPAKASFQVRTTLSCNKPIFVCILYICQRREDYEGFSNFGFFNDLFKLFFTEVKEINFSNPILEYKVKTVNLDSNIQILKYLIYYPLFRGKSIYYLYFFYTI